MDISQSLITTHGIRKGAQRVEVFLEQRRQSGAVECLDERKRGLTNQKQKKNRKKRKPRPSSALASARLLLPPPSCCVWRPRSSKTNPSRVVTGPELVLCSTAFICVYVPIANLRRCALCDKWLFICFTVSGQLWWWRCAD